MHLPVVLFIVLGSCTPLLPGQHLNPLHVPNATTTARPAPPKHPKWQPSDFPPGYNYTVFSGDCPCDRHKFRFCTWFKRRGPLSGKCYSVSRPSTSLRVHDPLVGPNNPLICYVYEDKSCTGRESLQQYFVDNTLCREPGQDLPDPFAYNSLRCWHNQY